MSDIIPENNLSRGSEWRKWDLHFHTPASYDYINKSLTDENVIQKLIENEIKVVAITDHIFIDCQRLKNLQRLADGKIAILPGIEFCSELGGSESIHFIGIFPENSDIDSIWTTLQGKLELTPADISKRGGVQNIQCDLTETCDIIHTLGGVTSIHGGSKSNTVENIKNTLIAKMEQKKRILSDYIDILEMGKVTDCEGYEKAVFPSIGFRLPMIICSDNHDILNYTLKENCWIKADTTFEGLKQIIYEPVNRVSIGAEKPDKYRENCVNSIAIENKDWFPHGQIPLNKGLVSIIGARGAGKTALLDFIALGLDSYTPSKTSFIRKAENKISPLTLLIEKDNQLTKKQYNKDQIDQNPCAQYLSQQFVEKLCSEDGSTDKLIEQVERFVFESIDNVNRLGTTNFAELRDRYCYSLDQNIISLKNNIEVASQEIARINNLKRNELKVKKSEYERHNIELNSLTVKLPKLDADIQTKWAQSFDILSVQKNTLEIELKNKRSKIQELQKIRAEMIAFSTNIAEKNIYFKEKLNELGLTAEILLLLNIQYDEKIFTNIDRILDSQKKDFQIKYGQEQNPVINTYRWFSNELEKIKATMKTLSEQEQYYYEISKKIQEETTLLAELDVQIKTIDALSIEQQQANRIQYYKDLFSCILEKKSILQSLYQPLTQKLKAQNKEQKLGFFVKVTIDLESWINQGESMIDLRRAQEYRDKKEFITSAHDILYNAWETCDTGVIETAISTFLVEHGSKMQRYLLEPYTAADLAKWIFSTDHISINYEITFDGVPINQLSPGTKGILLMILFLGVDINDARPLLIDQPEDNLDPESVFSILVPYFIEAKKRRQVIIVTHNPNLVVGTDSDQVIVASAEKKEIEALPQFKYFCGGLENPDIVKKVCSILEGGELAFKKRGTQYQLKLD